MFVSSEKKWRKKRLRLVPIVIMNNVIIINNCYINNLICLYETVTSTEETQQVDEEIQQHIVTESNMTISVLNNQFTDSETRSVINESENELLKIEIEKLKSKIDILKSQLF